MKPLFEKPRFGLSAPALWTFLSGILSLLVWILLATGILSQTRPDFFLLVLLIGGMVNLVLGIGAWQESWWCAAIGMWMYFLSVGIRLLVFVASDFPLDKIPVGVFHAWITWGFWKALKEWKLEERQEWLIASPIDDLASTSADVVSFDCYDAQPPELTSAIRSARSHVPEFIEAHEKRKPGDTFLVNAPIRHAESDYSESMWLEVTSIEPDSKPGEHSIFGILINTPLDTSKISTRKGQTVSVSSSELNDWIFIKGSKLPKGNFTFGILSKPTVAV